MNAARKAYESIPKMPAGGGGALGGLLALGLGSVGLYNSVVTVQPGHMGVVYNRIGGLADKTTLREGLNFVVPWFQRSVVFDVRTRPQLINTQSGSKDLQMVQISLRVLFKPNPNELSFIYRRLGKDYDERVLPSIVNEVTKAVVAQYNASELLTKRDVVSKQIRDMLLKRSNDFQILLDDVSITHLAFSKVRFSTTLAFCNIHRSHSPPPPPKFLDLSRCAQSGVHGGSRSQAGGPAGVRACQVHCGARDPGEADDCDPCRG